VDRHKFSATRRLSRRLQQVEKRNFNYPTCIWRPRWGDLIEFRRVRLRYATTVPVVFVLLRLADVVQGLLVTDGQTDRRRTDIGPQHIQRYSKASRL